MSRKSDALTGELFSTIPTPRPLLPGTMDFRLAVSELVAAGIAKSGMSRYAIAARMSELAEVETSKAILDSYTAPSREECNLPLWKAPVYEAASNQRHLAEWHAGVLGGRVLWGAEITDADLGRVERELLELQEQRRLLRQLQQHQQGIARGRR